MMTKCLKCGTEFKSFRVGQKNEKKFCSHACRTRYNSNHDYHTKWKISKKYVQKAKKRFNIWRKNNREQFNKSVVIAVKKYQKKMRKDAEIKGFCNVCFTVPVSNMFKTCEKCRKKFHKYYLTKVKKGGFLSN